MNIKDLDLSFVKNKNHNVKHVLFVNNETTEVVPVLKFGELPKEIVLPKRK